MSCLKILSLILNFNFKFHFKLNFKHLLLMENFTNQELADMHLAYGRTNCNARAAARLYQERYPERQHPGYKRFIAVHRRFAKTGMFKTNMHDTGVARNVRTVEFEEEVLQRRRIIN